MVAATPENNEGSPITPLEDAFLRVRNLFSDLRMDENNFDVQMDLNEAFTVYAKCWEGRGMSVKITKDGKPAIYFQMYRDSGHEGLIVFGAIKIGDQTVVDHKRIVDIGKSTHYEYCLPHKDWAEFGRLAIPLADGVEKIFKTGVIDLGFIRTIV